MKIIRFLFTIVLACVLTINVSAQDNGLNPVYKVQLGEITYQKGEASKKLTASKVLGVVADVVEGRVTDIHNEEYIPLATNCVKTGLTHVRRLQTIEADEVEDAKYLVTATLTDITASRKVKTYDRKDSKGREYKETKTYYGAVVTVALNFKNLQSGEVTTSSISGRCSKTKELYIDVGSRFIGEDVHFDVFIIGQVAGRETRKQIGRIRVRETLGDDISLCKVQKGGKDIKAAFDRGDAIVAISTD